MTDRPRRLDPAARRTQLLDVARAIVETDGVPNCTVDAVSDAAAVTPQLVHKYFGTRPALLQALYRREDDAYQADVKAKLNRADSFEEVVRVFVTANFDQLSSATAMGRLRVANETAEVRTERHTAGKRDAERILVRALQREYDTSPETTEFVLRLGSAASIEAGNLAAQRPERDRTRDIDDAVQFILAGIHAVVGA